MSAQKSGLAERAAEFFANMDARAWRALLVTTGLFVLVAIILVVGRLFFGDEIAVWVRSWLGGAERAHWGLPAAILVFCLTSLVGAPQFVLIAACVVAFGPETGFWYSWIATIASGAFTYVIGKVSGGRFVSKYAGATGGRFTRFMGKNGFLASFIIRFVPSAPFIVVNVAMATAGVAFLPFLAGLALGVLPKTAIVAFGGDVILDALEGKLGSALLGGLAAILAWFVLVYVLRRLVRRVENPETGPDA